MLTIRPSGFRGLCILDPYLLAGMSTQRCRGAETRRFFAEGRRGCDEGPCGFHGLCMLDPYLLAELCGNLSASPKVLLLTAALGFLPLSPLVEPRKGLEGKEDGKV